MAFLAAAPAILGGATIGEAALFGGTLLAGTLSAVSARNAGIEQSNQLQYQARIEADAAKQKEIERRRVLIQALASQNAQAGTAGIETSGSRSAIIMRDIRDAQNDLLVNDANTSSRLAALRSQASNARKAGNLKAVTSLLDTAKNAYTSAPGAWLS